MNAPAAALAEKVNGLLGGDNHVLPRQLGLGGRTRPASSSRAQYAVHESPGQPRYKSISRYYAYHGTTLATLAAGGMGDRKMKFEPLSGNDFVHVAPPYCYRCPFGLVPDSCGLACVKNMETTIQGEGPETVAEVIIEPVMSGVGVAVPPDDYLPAVADLCKQYGILLHVDEVINGFGRTGKLFAHQHYGVKPDIIALAKGISSAYLPMAATVISNRVFQSFVGDAAANRQVNQVNTYGGHPVAAAVAARNIEILLEEKLTERSAENGAYLLDALGTLQGAPPVDRRRPRQGPLRGRRARHRPRLEGRDARRRRSSRSSIAARTAASSSGARAAAVISATRSCWRRRSS